MAFLPAPATIVIPLFNQQHFTKLCLEYLVANTPRHLYELILVDNGSTDQTPVLVDNAVIKHGFISIRNETNLGFAKACNQGAREARGKYVVFLNNDTTPHPRWLEELIEVAEEEKNVGLVGSKLLFPDDKIQHAGVAFDPAGFPNHLYFKCHRDLAAANKQRDFSALTAACFLVGREKFLELGGFDENYRNGFEDIDFCLRLREAGLRIVYNPKSVVTHFESRSEGRLEKEKANGARFREIWKDRLKPDIYIYLNQDGMEMYVENGEFRFDSKEAVALKIQAAIKEAEALAAQGHVQEAAGLFMLKLKEYPFNPELMEALAKLMERLGVMPTAASMRAMAQRYREMKLPKYGNPPNDWERG